MNPGQSRRLQIERAMDEGRVDYLLRLEQTAIRTGWQHPSRRHLAGAIRGARTVRDRRQNDAAIRDQIDREGNA